MDKKEKSYTLFKDYGYDVFIRNAAEITAYPQIGIVLFKIRYGDLHDATKNPSNSVKYFVPLFIDVMTSMDDLFKVKTRENAIKLLKAIVNYVDCATVVDGSWMNTAIIAKNCARRFMKEEEGSHE